MKIYIRNKIKKLINTYKTNNPFELCDCLDISLIVAPLGNIWGMYQYIKKNRVIYLNSNLNEHQQRFVLAHELGHAVLHTKSSCFFTNTCDTKIKREYEANIFASELLINDLNDANIYLDGYTISQLSKLYCIPEELVKFKFN